MWTVLLLCLQAAPAGDELPLVRVTSDDFVVDRSCRLVLPEEPIPDAGEPGVVHVRGEGLTIEVEGTLRGAPEDTPWDELQGVGFDVRGAGHTLRGGAVRGFRVGMRLFQANRAAVVGWDFSDNYRQRLHSTPEREDLRDWLRPQDNWRGEWHLEYGAGLHARQCHALRIEGCRARRVQNGVLFELVSGSTVEGNDFSYLSGWGVALWRCYENVFLANRVDFCVRGYSHGVYNRGQDSAGFLLFEQCHRNEFRENSATHCGDGVFAFAGAMALGQIPPEVEGYRHGGRGNKSNLYWRNDLSYAAAHGLETTFARGERVVQNLMEGNAICGLWGGYSRGMEIHGNRFVANGDAGYGDERGGVNVEHGQRNSISSNDFRDNAAGVRLWWDEDPHLAALPWVEANGAESFENEVFGNRFRGEPVAIELDRAGPTYLADNRFRDVGTELVRDELSPEWQSPTATAVRTPSAPARPRGVAVRGREHIVMGPWGPWEGLEPLLVHQGGPRWRLHVPKQGWNLPEDASADVRWASGEEASVPLADDGRFTVPAPGVPGVHPYELHVLVLQGGNPIAWTADGTYTNLEWSVRCFPTTADPREDEAAWRAAADAATPVARPALDLVFGGGSPAALDPALGVDAADRFGTLAEATVPLPAGEWILDTSSDDGLRVLLDGERVLDDWTWHPPRRLEHRFRLDEPRTVSLRVEHFELDGHAELRVHVRPSGD